MPTLPTLKQVWLKAAWSLLKNKNRFRGDYSATLHFTERFDTVHIQRFCSYFGFSNPLPLPYFYLFAQRTHLALMLSKNFPVPVVGLVHLENGLELLATPNINQPFEISATVSTHAADGSIPFSFDVIFSQKGKAVVRCTSLYLCKRVNKSTPKIKKAKPEVSLTDLDNQSAFTIAANKGNGYARLSGDYNPIHTTTLLAKAFGFKKKIIHGWYTLCHSAALLENTYHKPAVKLEVSFQNPIFLPGKAVVHYSNLLPAQNTSQVRFSVTNNGNSLLHAQGIVGF